jgi:hypothetical protein
MAKHTCLQYPTKEDAEKAIRDNGDNPYRSADGPFELANGNWGINWTRYELD